MLFFSIHRCDNGAFYPGTGFRNECGAGAGVGFNINVPLPGPGLGDWEYVQTWERLLVPVARAFAPDLIVVSAGFDAALGDPLGGTEVTPPCYAHLTRVLLPLTTVPGRVAVALEGGYNTAAISESFAHVVHVLLGDEVSMPPLDSPGALEGGLRAIKRAFSCAHCALFPYAVLHVVLYDAEISRGTRREKKHHAAFKLELVKCLRIQAAHWPCLAEKLQEDIAELCPTAASTATPAKATPKKADDATAAVAVAAAASAVAAPPPSATASASASVPARVPDISVTASSSAGVEFSTPTAASSADVFHTPVAPQPNSSGTLEHLYLH